MQLNSLGWISRGHHPGAGVSWRRCCCFRLPAARRRGCRLPPRRPPADPAGLRRHPGDHLVRRHPRHRRVRLALRDLDLVGLRRPLLRGRGALRALARPPSASERRHHDPRPPRRRLRAPGIARRRRRGLRRHRPGRLPADAGRAPRPGDRVAVLASVRRRRGLLRRLRRSFRFPRGRPHRHPAVRPDVRRASSSCCRPPSPTPAVSAGCGRSCPAGHRTLGRRSGLADGARVVPDRVCRPWSSPPSTSGSSPPATPAPPVRASWCRWVCGWSSTSSPCSAVSPPGSCCRTSTTRWRPTPRWRRWCCRPGSRRSS